MPNTIPVLMIDDNEDDIVLLRERLASLPDGPYELSSEVDAENAIAQVKAINPAVIFLDYRLSTTTGLEVIREMRKQGLLQPATSYFPRRSANWSPRPRVSSIRARWLRGLKIAN